MINLDMAGLVVGIDNHFDLSPWVGEWLTEREPDFTVRLENQDISPEDVRKPLPMNYLEFTNVYRKIAERLPEYDAFVFHGAAVALGGKAYLFAAPSGTGKTTHSLQWLSRYPEAWILNGDKPILRRFAQGFWVCGTPWRGKERAGGPGMLPLGGLCFLSRGREDRIRPVQGPAALNRLMRQCYLPQDPAQMERFLPLLEAFSRQTPCWALECTISTHAAEVAHDAMVK